MVVLTALYFDSCEFRSIGICKIGIFLLFVATKKQEKRPKERQRTDANIHYLHQFIKRFNVWFGSFLPIYKAFYFQCLGFQVCNKLLTNDSKNTGAASTNTQWSYL